MLPSSRICMDIETDESTGEYECECMTIGEEDTVNESCNGLIIGGADDNPEHTENELEQTANDPRLFSSGYLEESYYDGCNGLIIGGADDNPEHTENELEQTANDPRLFSSGYLEESCYDVGYDCDQETDDDLEDLFVRRRKGKRQRGRPFGSKKQQHDSEEDSYEPKPKRQKSNPYSITAIAAVFCCIAMCLATVTPDSLVQLREHVSPMSMSELSQWVLDWLWTHPRSDGGHCFLIGEWSVCLHAFLAAIGMPLSTYYTIQRRYRNGQKVINKRGCNSKVTSASQTAVMWLHDYACKFADKLPDSVKLHLPSCLTKQSVYDMYVEEMSTDMTPTISKSHFFCLWRTCLSYIVIPKKSRFSQCDFCIDIKTQLAETKDKVFRKKLIEDRRKHLLKQGRERQKYYKHALKAKQQPQKYLSIIIDGMDQSKTDIPHFLYLSSLAAGMWKLRTHLIGAIIHGIGTYGYFDFYQYPHGSNLTIHVLLQLLMSLKNSLPPVLYLQLDNCGRENKNRFILGLLCLFVEKGIFKKIKLSFLMKGHTHEDIDQCFSRFSVWLQKHAATTLPKLMAGWCKAMTPNPKAHETTNVLNFTEWLQTFLHQLSGHSQPHTYKISLGKEGKAKIVFKEWANDKHWRECSGTEKFLLKDIPHTHPTELTPSLAKLDLDRLRTDVEKTVKIYAKEDLAWWNSFFHKADSTSRDTPAQLMNVIDELVAATSRQRSNQIQPSTSTYPDDEPKKVTKPIEVTIGRRQKTQAAKPTEKTMVLLDVPKYDGEWPQVAEVQDVDGDRALVQWFKGSKTTAWQPCKVRSVTGGKWVLWTEYVDINTIWFSGFKLTPSGRLPQYVKDTIDEYDQ